MLNQRVLWFLLRFRSRSCCYIGPHQHSVYLVLQCKFWEFQIVSRTKVENSHRIDGVMGLPSKRHKKLPSVLASNISRETESHWWTIQIVDRAHLFFVLPLRVLDQKHMKTIERYISNEPSLYFDIQLDNFAAFNWNRAVEIRTVNRANCDSMHRNLGCTINGHENWTTLGPLCFTWRLFSILGVFFWWSRMQHTSKNKLSMPQWSSHPMAAEPLTDRVWLPREMEAESGQLM